MALSQYRSYQLENARLAIDLTRQFLGPRVATRYVEKIIRCVLATLIVESSLRGAIDFGDQPKWFGAFQQNDNWIKPELRNTAYDPRYTMAGGLMMFLFGGDAEGTRGLLEIFMQNPGRPIHLLCWDVQRSEFPGGTKYAEALPDADAIIGWVASHPA